MKRPRFPSPPVGVKISSCAIRDLAWYARRKKTEPYATKPCVALKIDGYWTSPITIFSHNWDSKGKTGIKIGYSSGGQNESDNFDYIHNFTAGLQYAVVLADWLDEFFIYVESTVKEMS